MPIKHKMFTLQKTKNPALASNKAVRFGKTQDLKSLSSNKLKEVWLL